VTTHDVIGWLVSSIIGFATGYLVAFATRRVAEVETEASSSRWAAKRAGILRAVFGGFLFVMALATFLQSYAVDQCTNNALATISDAEGQKNRAQIELLETNLRATSREDAIAATQRYLEAAKALEQARVDTPIRCNGPFPFPK
jgi:hypothetical protein